MPWILEEQEGVDIFVDELLIRVENGQHMTGCAMYCSGPQRRVLQWRGMDASMG